MTSSFRTPESETTRKALYPTSSHHSAIWWLLRVVSEAEKKITHIYYFWSEKYTYIFWKSHIEISQIIQKKKGNETLQPASQYWPIRRHRRPVQHVKTRSCVRVARISVIVTLTLRLNVVSEEILLTSQQLLLGLMNVVVLAGILAKRDSISILAVKGFIRQLVHWVELNWDTRWSPTKNLSRYRQEKNHFTFSFFF